MSAHLPQLPVPQTSAAAPGSVSISSHDVDGDDDIETIDARTPRSGGPQIGSQGTCEDQVEALDAAVGARPSDALPQLRVLTPRDVSPGVDSPATTAAWAVSQVDSGTDVEEDDAEVDPPYGTKKGTPERAAHHSRAKQRSPSRGSPGAVSNTRASRVVPVSAEQADAPPLWAGGRRKAAARSPPSPRSSPQRQAWEDDGVDHMQLNGHTFQRVRSEPLSTWWRDVLWAWAESDWTSAPPRDVR